MTIRRHLRNFISFYLGTPFKINSNNEVETKLTKTIDGIQILSIYLNLYAFCLHLFVARRTLQISLFSYTYTYTSATHPSISIYLCSSTVLINNLCNTSNYLRLCTNVYELNKNLLKI